MNCQRDCSKPAERRNCSMWGGCDGGTKSEPPVVPIPPEVWAWFDAENAAREYLNNCTDVGDCDSRVEAEEKARDAMFDCLQSIREGGKP